MTEKERAKQLAEEHWNGYTSDLVEMHSGCYSGKFYTHEEMLKLCKFHFVSAAVHFHGHGVEDERNGMFRPSIGEPLTTGEVAAIARPCSNCYDEKQCQGGLRLASGDCLHYWAKDDTKCSVCKSGPTPPPLANPAEVYSSRAAATTRLATKASPHANPPRPLADHAALLKRELRQLDGGRLHQPGTGDHDGLP